MKRLSGFLYFMFALATAMVGHHIHGGLFWTLVDFFFAPLAWAKWLVFHQVNVSIIRSTFAFFLQ